MKTPLSEAVEDSAPPLELWQPSSGESFSRTKQTQGNQPCKDLGNVTQTPLRHALLLWTAVSMMGKKKLNPQNPRTAGVGRVFWRSCSRTPLEHFSKHRSSTIHLFFPQSPIMSTSNKLPSSDCDLSLSVLLGMKIHTEVILLQVPLL